VNNAGIQHVAPVDEFPPEKWDAIIAINLNSAFHTVRAALPGMKAKGWGRIVNIASAHGLVASPFKSAYVAAKHGLVGLTKDRGARDRRQGRYVQRCLSGLRAHAAGRKADRRSGRAHKIRADEVISKVILERQPSKEFVKGRGGGCAHSLPVRRRRGVDHRDHAEHRRRVDSAVGAPDHAAFWRASDFQ